MPTVGDLDCIGQCPCSRFSVAAASVTRDDANAGMGGKPRGGGRDLVVGQKLDDAAPFQIADDRAATMVAPEGPIVDADHCQGSGPGMRPAPNGVQQRVVADWDHKPCRESGTGSSAKARPR